MTFTPMRRSQIVETVCKLDREFSDLEAQYHSEDKSVQTQLDERKAAIDEELSMLYVEYRDGLPKVLLSRCPFCHTVAELSMDNFGLDGLWWSVDSPIRKIEYSPDPHFLAYTGAVELQPPLESMDRLVAPGPQAPFVVPSVLSHPNVKAVLYSLPIGLHRAFTIWYFANPIPFYLPLVNDWGIESYTQQTGQFDKTGRPIYSTAEAYHDESDFDFELEPWIRRGKLLWILPNDPSLKLNDRTDGCPYLNLPGKREEMYLKNGEAWSGEDSD